MLIGRNKLYILLFFACLLGYVWVYFSVAEQLVSNESVEVCLVKHVTGVPCPSCGATRSVASLTKGEFLAALHVNPIGYIIASIMLIAPIWITADVLFNKQTLYNFYQRMESFLRKPHYAIPLAILVIANWIWNISKGL